MSKSHLLITLSLIIVLVITDNVYSHQYAPRPKPMFPYTKFSQKLDVVRRVKVQVPKVHDVEMDEIISSITPISETQNHKLQEFDILPVLHLNFLRVHEAIICYVDGCICLGEVIVPPLPSVPPIITPIADPFNDDLLEMMSLEEFFLWLRKYR